MPLSQTKQLIAAGLLFASSACTTAETKEAAVIDAGPPPCTGRLSVECDAGAPGPSRCMGDPAAVDNRRFLPADIGFTPGCFAYFQQLDCSTEGYCYCAAADAGPARWICPP